jgi:hypothetical protein
MIEGLMSIVTLLASILRADILKRGWLDDASSSSVAVQLRAVWINDAMDSMNVARTMGMTIDLILDLKKDKELEMKLPVIIIEACTPVACSSRPLELIVTSISMDTLTAAGSGILIQDTGEAFLHKGASPNLSRCSLHFRLVR